MNAFYLNFEHFQHKSVLSIVMECLFSLTATSDWTHLKYKLTLAVMMFLGAESVPLMFSSSSNIIETTKGRILQRGKLYAL